MPWGNQVVGNQQEHFFVVKRLRCNQRVLFGQLGQNQIDLVGEQTGNQFFVGGFHKAQTDMGMGPPESRQERRQ